jgi:hypothetical protein
VRRRKDKKNKLKKKFVPDRSFFINCKYFSRRISFRTEGLWMIKRRKLEAAFFVAKKLSGLTNYFFFP